MDEKNHSSSATVHMAAAGWLRLCGKAEILSFDAYHSWSGGSKLKRVCANVSAKL